MNVMVWLIVALGLGTAFCIYKFFDSRKKQIKTEIPDKSDKKAVIDDDKPTKTTVKDVLDSKTTRDCYVYVDKIRRVMIKPVLESELTKIREIYGSLGRLWNREGQQLYALNENPDGTYVPVEKFMSTDLKNSPRKAFLATQQQETESYFANKDNRSFIQKYGAILLFAGVVFFIMFMWVKG